MRRYDGKSVIVTGAASGLGKEMARRFAAEGAKLVISDINAPALEALRAEIAASGASVEAFPADIADEATAPMLVEACLKAYGVLDVAVNNAGIIHPMTKVPQITAQTMRRILEVNYMGVFLALKAQIPVMEKRGQGVILNVASVAGVSGAPLLGAYAASKHAVVGLTKTAAAESARKGVRINALCPASTDTPMVGFMIESMGRDPKEAHDRIAMLTPMARLATVDEIVQGALWICSPENSFMTGHALVIDGGLTTI